MTDEELIARLRGWAKDVQERSKAIWAMDQDLKVAADRIEQLVDELNTMKTAGIIEVANRNNRVTEYMFYWESRAMDAEARAERLEAALQKLACKCPSNCDWERDDICPSWIARAALKGDDHE